MNKDICVFFIHGYGKTIDDWDVTNKGKQINIAERVSKTYNVILVQLDESDYAQSTKQIATQMHEQLQIHVSHCKVVIVAHSSGSFYAIHLAQMDPKKYVRLLLIDPTVKSENYRKYLIEQFTNTQQLTYLQKLIHFEDLPCCSVPSKSVVRIHCNFEDKKVEKIQVLHDLVKLNVKSRLFVHYNASHMVHYKIPDVIIDSILEICTTR